MDLIIQTIALGFLLIVILKAKLSKQQISRPRQPAYQWLRVWMSTFLGSLTVIAILIILVDPRGYYAVGLLPARSQPDRYDKVHFYAALERRPDVLLLASSRGRNITSDAVITQTELSLFNAALSGGRVGEMPVFLRYAESFDEKGFPPVLMVELLPTVTGETALKTDLWPITMIRLMSPSMQQRAISARITAPFSLANLSEAILSLSYHMLHSEDTESMRFDGNGVERIRILSDEDFNHTIDLIITEDRSASYCAAVDPDVSVSLDEIISIANDHASSVVLYFSPLQPRYYEEALAPNESYQTCYTAYRNHLQALADGDESVFFIDLLHPQGIETFDTPDYYYDQWHFNPPVGEWLIGEMRDTLQAAYEHALARRQTS